MELGDAAKRLTVAVLGDLPQHLFALRGRSRIVVFPQEPEAPCAMLVHEATEFRVRTRRRPEHEGSLAQGDLENPERKPSRLTPRVPARASPSANRAGMS